MKPRPRLRRAVARWGAVVSAVLLLVWWASAFGAVLWSISGTLSVAISKGQASGDVVNIPGFGPLPTGLSVERLRGPHQWWFDWSFHPSHRFFRFPLWLPTALALAATITARRLDAKAPRLNSASACPRCAYPRAGLAAGAVCPECGSPGPTP